MILVDHTYSKKWLEQFDLVDLPLARALLRSLKLVSHSEFEDRIAQLVLDISNKTEGRIALFPVSRLPNKSYLNNEKRPHYGSAERIGQTLTNIERANPRFQVAPTVKGMKSEKTKHVVLVDDIVGSGRRIREYCYGLLGKSVKSWCSYHKCTLWIVVYAGHWSSVEALTHRFGYLHLENIKLWLRLPDMVTLGPREGIRQLCSKYAKNTPKRGAPLGVGDLMTQIIFQHGCPNNAPVVLWASGKNWKALFPNRGIPQELNSCFDTSNTDETEAESLWQSAQYSLAMAILDRMNRGKSDANDIQIIVVLGLLSRGIQPDKISQLMLRNQGEISAIIKHAKNLKLIGEDYRVTGFGRDLLDRFRHQKASSRTLVQSNEDAIRFYYPQQYRGIQRKSSS